MKWLDRKIVKFVNDFEQLHTLTKIIVTIPLWGTLIALAVIYG